MNLDYELLQFFVYKKIVKRKDVDEIMEACKRLNMPVEKYLAAKEYCNEVSALYAMSEFFCIPAVELDMLDIDKELFDKFSFDFMKKHKVVPVCRGQTAGHVCHLRRVVGVYVSAGLRNGASRANRQVC